MSDLELEHTNEAAHGTTLENDSRPPTSSKSRENKGWQLDEDLLTLHQNNPVGRNALRVWSITEGLDASGTRSGVMGRALNPAGVGVVGISQQQRYYGGSKKIPVTGLDDGLGTGTGVRGVTGTGIGVEGWAITTRVAGLATPWDPDTVSTSSGTGVLGVTGAGAGVHGHAWGIWPNTDPKKGPVAPQGLDGVGVQGDADFGTGVVGTTNASDRPAVGGIGVGYGVIGSIAGPDIYDGFPAGVLGVGSYDGIGTAGTSANIGLLGYGPAGSGVVGMSETGHGVFGSASANDAVVGVAKTGAGVAGSTDEGAGVNGRAGDGVGVFGSAATGTGVIGYAGGDGHGVVGTSNVPTRFGVFGFNDAGMGVGGKSNSGIGVVGGSRSGTGVNGGSQYGVGVNGGSLAGIGVASGSAGGIGLYAFNLVPKDSKAVAAVFDGNVLIRGNVTITKGFGLKVETAGNKHCVVTLPDRSQRLLYAVESPDAWFEDFGEAALVRGKAHVSLDRLFVQCADTRQYHVFLTAYGETAGLYVSRRTRNGFDVLERKPGRSSVRFSWRLVARPKGEKKKRFARTDNRSLAHIETVLSRNSAIKPGLPLRLESGDVERAAKKIARHETPRLPKLPERQSLQLPKRTSSHLKARRK